MREQRERIQDESAEHAGMQLNHESQNDFVASDEDENTYRRILRSVSGLARISCYKPLYFRPTNRH